MSRNMIKENEKFFCNIINSLDEEFVERVCDCKRFISTNENDKDWLKNLHINRIHRFTKNSYGLLLEYDKKEYVCLIDTNTCLDKLPEVLKEIDVNAGLATVLGAEGMLTFKVDKPLQREIYDKVLYETGDDYHGHEWEDIRQYFPSVYCYEIILKDDAVDICENVNAFYRRDN